MSLRTKLGRAAHDFLTSGAFDRYGVEITRKIIMANIIFATGVAILIPYGLHSMTHGAPALGTLDLCMAAVLASAALFLRLTHRYLAASYFGIFVMSAFYLYLFASGAFGGTGHLWSYNLPLFVLFLLGVKVGSLVIFAYLAAVMLILFGGLPFVKASYGAGLRTRFVGSFIAIYVLAYFFEYVRANTQAKISQQKEDLEKSEQRLRDIVLSSSDLVWEADREWRYTYVSAGLEELLGHRAEDALGKTIFDFVSDDDGSRARRAFDEASGKKATVVDLEWRCTHKDGRTVWLLTNAVPVVGSAGTVDGFRGVSKDITERIRAQEERQLLEDQLRHAQKMEAIGQLAGGIAHDFNNVLGAISGYADLMKRRLPEQEEKLRRYATMIRQAAQRAADLTAKLLAFARKGTYTLVDIDIHELVDETCKVLEHTIDKRITIGVSLEADNPHVQGDRPQLQNVLINLAVNARDAMPQGGEMRFATRNVCFDEHESRRHAGARPGSYVRISVSDTGHGMDAGVVEHIFEPFFTTKEPGKGTGLGLASVYGSVKSHQGFIEIDSALGRGTTFDVYLPAGAEASAASGAAALSGGTRGKQGESCAVLVVDDEETVREVFREMLEDIGCTVVAVGTGREAVEYYREHPGKIDVVVLDMIMPAMGGLQCFRELKKTDPKVKVVLSSGYTVGEEGRHALDEGALAFLHKPVDSDDLCAAVLKAARAR